MNKRNRSRVVCAGVTAWMLCALPLMTAHADTTTIPAETTAAATAAAAETTTLSEQVTTEPTTSETTTETTVLQTIAVPTQPFQVAVHSDPATRMTTEPLPDGTLCLKEFRWESGELRVEIPAQIDGKDITVIGEQAFMYCYADEVVLPDTVREIGNHAFSNCVYLRSMTIPENCTRIGTEAFSGCERLAAVIVGASLREIGEDAFAGTPFLNAQSGEYVVLGDGILCAYHGNAAKLELPTSIKAIASHAFEGHTELRSLVLPDSIEQVQSGAFAGCESLSEITAPAVLASCASDAFSDTKWFRDAKGDAVMLGNLLLRWNGTGTVAEIPDGVRAINEAAFADQTVITTLRLPDSVEEIRTEAFRGCSSLQVATLGDHLRRIDARAFSGCQTLKYLRLGHQLETIGEDAFLTCPYLEEVYLPDTLREIGTHAFGYAQDPDSARYEKLRNSLMLYSNTEIARKFAEDAGINHAPLPDVENTEPAPMITTKEGEDGGIGSPSGRAWIPAVMLGGMLAGGGGISRLRKRRV